MYDRTNPGMDVILSAASRLFRERGIAGASMRAIAGESGVLLGSLTYRYRTKSDLLLAVMTAGVDRAIAQIEDASSADEDPLLRLRLALRAHLRELLAADSAVWLLLNEWGRLPPESREALRVQRRRYEAVWGELVSAAAASGALAPGLDLRLVHLFVFGAANSVAHWYRADGSRSPDEIADAFSAFIGVGVLADEVRPVHVGPLFAELCALNPTSTPE